jgi:hypothetical protein
MKKPTIRSAKAMMYDVKPAFMVNPVYVPLRSIAIQDLSVGNDFLSFPDSYLMTEDGSFLMTESGDYLVT